MKRTYYLPIAMMLALITYSCSDEFQEAVSTSPTPLKLTGQISQENVTRANDYGFVTGDRMGIYVVDYENNQPGDLASSSIRAQNVLYTFDGDSYSWSSSTSIYWRDKQTPVSIYGYYPGQNYIADPTAWNFSVQTDQSTPAENGSLSGYEQSDLLWGKEGRVEFTQDQIVIKYHHILAGVRVHLNKGTGISDTEWQKLEKIVLVDHTKTTSNVDLATGSVIANGEIAPIHMAVQSNDDYRAVVIPQTVAAGKQLLSITLDGQTYSHKLTTDMVYQSGKLHNFTMTVNKSEATGDYQISVTDDGITPWINDESSHQFTANSYVVVHCPEPGKLGESITKAGYDYKTLENLKVTGQITTEDFYYLRDKMPKLANLYLRDAKVVKGLMYEKDMAYNSSTGKRQYLDDVIPDQALYRNTTIRSLVLPARLKRIGHRALGDMDLQYSTLEIPEGVTQIGHGALAGGYNPSDSRNPHVDMTIPNTLEYIDRYAFSGNGYRCELRLSDIIHYIGDGAFSQCPRFYGTFHIPSKIDAINYNVFHQLGTSERFWQAEANNAKFNGEIVIPQGITEIGNGAFSMLAWENRIRLTLPQGLKKIGSSAFSSLRLDALSLPEGLLQIDDFAFERTNMPFTLHLPATLLQIGQYSFLECSIEGDLTITAKLENIPDYAFARNNIKALHLPTTLQLIGKAAFCDNEQLQQVTLPRYLDRIDDRAFANCGALNTVICLNTEPPILGTDVWCNVEMDKVILMVPEQSVELYRNDDSWSQFHNITAYHELAINLPSMNTLNKGGQRSAVIRAEGSWKVADCPSWCHVNPMSGTGKTEVSITIDAQPTSAPERIGRLVFTLQNKKFTTYVDLHQFAYDYGEDQTVILQQATAKAAQPIPLFIVGDGFNATQIASGEYLEVMRQQMEYFFSIEPLKTYRNYFTVSTAIALSSESGVGTAQTGTVNNKFSTILNDGELNGNDDDIFSYAASYGEAVSWERLPHTTILVVANAPWVNQGLTMLDDGRTIVRTALSQDSYPYDQRGMVLHNVCGRAFGKLAPEYLTHPTFIQACTCSCCNGLPEYKRGKSLGWYENVSLSSKMNEVPWSHLIFHPKYSEYVDIYEGAYRHARGVYRSEPRSIMRDYTPYFNTISREAIVRRIMEYAGEKYSFDKFVEKDKIEIPE